MKPTSRRTVGLVLVLLGLFGAAFAVSGLFAALPAPAVGGTCGPGRSSESAIVAFFDPVSIGAGAEPAAATTTTTAIARADWMAFVGECQASADSRVLATLFLLVLSVVVVLVGVWMAVRGTRPTSSSTIGATTT
jgi:hypothetical protein